MNDLFLIAAVITVIGWLSIIVLLIYGMFDVIIGNNNSSRFSLRGFSNWLIKTFIGNNIIVSVPMMLISYPFRRWAGRIVYNHIILNNIPVVEIMKRKPRRLHLYSDKYPLGFYVLTSEPRATEYTGQGRITVLPTWYINLFYPIAFALWVWHDDSTNVEMVDMSFSSDVYIKERFKFLPKFITNNCQTTLTSPLENEKMYDPIYVGNKFGSFFDVGERQQREFNFTAGVLWCITHSMANFNYYIEQNK